MSENTHTRRRRRSLERSASRDVPLTSFRQRIRARSRRGRDGGMTIPELLIGVSLMGIVMAALSSAVIVVLRQTDNTEGRLNNARSEQGIGLWMPADLASAAENADGKLVVTAANASPCFGACPPGLALVGSNALLLEWTTTISSGSESVLQTTRVSYRYALVAGEYQMIRFECTQIEGGAQSCKSFVVLHDLDGPPDGIFVPGTTEPTWIIAVKDPYKPDATTEDQTDPGLISKNSSRVVVTINGGGDVAGAGGGTNQISISAGGTNRTIIDGTSLQGAPTLIAARSRCGGAITMIIDESNSIGDAAILKMRDAISGFVTIFNGTPVKLQLVVFSSKSGVLGTNTANPWSRYFDMLLESDVTELKGLANTIAMNGSTNWEDGLQRAFFKQNGDIQTIVPGLVVFFTDGVPTFSRLNQTSATSATNPPARLPGYSLAGGGTYNQEAFYRANLIAAQFRNSIRMIGIGIGPDISNNQTWINSIPGYHYDYFRNFHYDYNRKYHYDYTHKYHWDYSRGYHIERSFHYEVGSNYTYSRGYHIENSFHYQVANNTYQRGYHLEKSFHYETKTKSNGSFNPVTKAVYDAETRSSYKQITYEPSIGNASLDYWDLDTSGSTTLSASRRVKFTQPYNATVTVTPSTIAVPDGATSWTPPGSGPTNGDEYTANNNHGQANSYTDATDEWTRTAGTYSNVTLAAYTSAFTYDKQKLAGAPTGTNDYWEVDASAVALGTNTLDASHRVSFTAPFTFTKVVTMTALATADNAKVWTATSTATNQSIYNTQNVPANGDASATDGWSRVAGTWTDSTLAAYNSAGTYDKRITVEPALGNSLDYWEIDPSASQLTQPDSGRRINFTTPFLFGKVVTMTAVPTKDGGYGSSAWSSTIATPYATNQAAYDAQNIAANGDASLTDGWMRTKNYSSPFTEADVDNVGSGYVSGDPSWQVTAKIYTAPFTNTDAFGEDGSTYSASDPSWSVAKIYSAPFTQQEATSSSGYQSNNLSWTRVKNYTAPFDAFDAPITTQVKSSTILARLIAGSDTGVPATTDGAGKYNNAAVANMYISPDWDQLDDILTAVALAECGGTLTIQTRLGTKKAPDPFTYQKSKVWDSTGAPVVSDQTVVTTNQTFASGTFDLATSTYLTLEIQPVNLSDLTGYSAGTWACKAGSNSVPFELVNIPGSNWKGIKVRVAANQAVSCTQTVTR